MTRRRSTRASAASCATRRGGLRNAGPFTPYRVSRRQAKPPRSTVVSRVRSAARIGVAPPRTRRSASCSSTRRMWAVSVGSRRCRTTRPRRRGKRGAEDAARYRRASAVGGPSARFWWAGAVRNEPGAGERAWPCQKPPWGRLSRSTSATGDIAWSVPLGDHRAVARGQAADGPRRISAAPIATAGGLVVHRRDQRSAVPRVRLADGRRSSGSRRCRCSAHAMPITYLGADGSSSRDRRRRRGRDRRRRASGAQALVAFALPLTRCPGVDCRAAQHEYSAAACVDRKRARRRARQLGAIDGESRNKNGRGPIRDHGGDRAAAVGIGRPSSSRRPSCSPARSTRST